MLQRYYIGLSMPYHIGRQITQAQRRLFDPSIAVKPLEPHITLLPPPAVTGMDRAELTARCKAAAEPFWPLRLTMTAIGASRGRSVFIDINGGYLHKLQQCLVALLPENAQITYYPEVTFHPHITLAQARREHHLPGGLAHEYEQLLRTLFPCTFIVTHLTLYRANGPRTYSAEPL